MTDVVLRDAATVLILRDGPDGLEVFMVRRNLNSDFVGGAYVFPGGAVDPDDRHADLERDLRGPHRRRGVSRRLGIDARRPGLLGRGRSARASRRPACCWPYRPDGVDRRSRRPEHASAFGSSTAARSTTASAGSSRSAPTRACASRWTACTTSATGSRRRARPGATTPASSWPPSHPGQTPLHDDHEVIANVWIRPADALRAHAAGEFTMMPPTVASLRAVARFATAADALAAATAIIDVPTILPRIIADRRRHAHRVARRSRATTRGTPIADDGQRRLADLPHRRHHRLRPGGHRMTERLA